MDPGLRTAGRGATAASDFPDTQRLLIISSTSHNSREVLFHPLLFLECSQNIIEEQEYYELLECFVRKRQRDEEKSYNADLVVLSLSHV